MRPRAARARGQAMLMQLTPLMLVITTLGCASPAPPPQRLVDTSHAPTLAHARDEQAAQATDSPRARAQEKRHLGPARDAFLKAEEKYEALGQVALNVPMSELADAYSRHVELSSEAIKLYTAVFQLKDDYWSCAALLRMGQILEAQADLIASAPLSPSMTLAQARKLKDDYGRRSEHYRQEAAKLYQYAAALGQRHPSSPWARRALEAHERLRPTPGP